MQVKMWNLQFPKFYNIISILLDCKYLTDDKGKACDLWLFWLESDVVLEGFVIVVLIAGPSTSAVFLLFIRLFWNQILIWRSGTAGCLANWKRRGRIRYLLQENSFSISSSCTLFYAVRMRFFPVDTDLLLIFFVDEGWLAPVTSTVVLVGETQWWWLRGIQARLLNTLWSDCFVTVINVH